MKDDQLSKAIVQGGDALWRALEELRMDPDIMRQLESYIMNKGGNKSDAEDVLHEGLRNVILNIRSGKYRGTGSLKAYLIVICKNLWITQFNRRINLNRIKKDINFQDRTEESPESKLFWNERATLLKDVLTQVGQSCKKVLGLWSLGYSFKEIGVKTNRKEGAARKHKHSCFKKLMVFLKNNPALMNELRQLKIQ